jgi:hypothetical protein
MGFSPKQEYKYVLLKQLKLDNSVLYVLFMTEQKATDLIKYKHKTFVDYL